LGPVTPINEGLGSGNISMASGNPGASNLQSAGSAARNQGPINTGGVTQMPSNSISLGNGELEQLKKEEILKRQIKREDEILSDVQQEVMSHQRQISVVHSKTRTVEAEVMWPEEKLFNPNCQREYDELMAIGRCITDARVHNVNNDLVASSLRSAEYQLSLKAAKVKLSDVGEGHIASMMSLEKEGSFMEKVKDKIKEARKNVASGIKRSFPLDPPNESQTNLTVHSGLFQHGFGGAGTKRARVLEKHCWNCGQSGHLRNECPQAIVELGNGKSSDPRRKP